MADTSHTPATQTALPRPEGDELADLYAIFTDVRSPSSEQIAVCDDPLKKLRAVARGADEVLQGARELVRRFPEQQHWCVYGKQLELERYLEDEPDLALKQKRITETYLYAAPAARAFFIEQGDSTYLDWASRHYQRLSARMFNRPLDLSPSNTIEMLTSSRGRAGGAPPPGPSVFEKYGITLPAR